MTTYNVEIVINGRDNASGPLGSAGGALSRIGQITAGILSAQLFTRMADGILNIGKAALQSYADHERLGMSLQSLTARELINNGAARDMNDAMGKASPIAQELLGWIQKLAIESPFKQEDVASAFRLAQAYGFTTDESKRLTQAMIDFSSGSGASADSMNRISLALGQIKARGKLAGQEIMQLTETGLPVRDILAKAFGVTTARLEEMISDGLVPADKAIEAITKSLENDFGGAAKRQAATFSGLISSLSDIKDVGLREFFTGTFQTIQPYLSKFVDTFSDPKVMANIREMGNSLGKMLEPIFKGIGSLAGFSTGIHNVTSELKNLVGLRGLSGLSDELGRQTAVQLQQGMGQAAKQLNFDTMVKNIFNGIVGTFGTVLGGGGLAIVGTMTGAAIVSGVGPAIASGLGKVINNGAMWKSIFYSTTYFIRDHLSSSLASAFFDVFKTGGVLAKLGGSIGGVFGGVFGGLSGFAGMLTPLAGVITSVIAPLLLLVGAVMLVAGTFALFKSGKLNEYLAPLQGIFEGIKKTFMEMLPTLQQVGATLSGAFMGAAQELASRIIPWLVTQLGKFADWFKENRPLIEKFVITIANFFTSVLFPAVLQAWNVIAPILTGIVDLVLGVVKAVMQAATGDWSGAWETIKTTFVTVTGDLWKAITEFFGGLATWVTSWFNTDWKTVGDQWGSFFAGLGKSISQYLNTIATYWMNFFQNVGANAGAFFTSLGQSISQYLNTIVTYWINFFASLWNACGAAWSNISAGWTTFWEGVGKLFKQKFADIVAGIVTFGTNAALKFDSIKNGIFDKVKEITATVAGYFETMKTNIINMIGDFVTIGGDIINNILTGLQNNVEALKTYLSKLIADLISSLLGQGGATNEMGALISEGIGNMLNGLNTALKVNVTPSQMATQRSLVPIYAGSSHGGRASNAQTAAGNQYSQTKQTSNHFGTNIIYVKDATEARKFLREFRPR